MVEFLEINLTVLLGSHLWLGPLWIFWLSNFSIVCLQQFRFFYPNNSSQGGFCSYVCSSKLRLPIFTCVSNLGGSDFPFLWIQEELLIVWSIQFFSLLLMSANTLRGNHQMLSFFMWLTSLEDFCHLIPSYFSISSMLSTTIYVALYLDLKFFFFFGRSVGIL